MLVPISFQIYHKQEGISFAMHIFPCCVNFLRFAYMPVTEMHFLISINLMFDVSNYYGIYTFLTHLVLILWQLMSSQLYKALLNVNHSTSTLSNNTDFNGDVCLHKRYETYPAVLFLSTIEQMAFIIQLHVSHFIWYSFNILRPRQNGHLFRDNVFKGIFLHENVGILIKILLKSVPN